MDDTDLKVRAKDLTPRDQQMAASVEPPEITPEEAKEMIDRSFKDRPALEKRRSLLGDKRLLADRLGNFIMSLELAKLTGKVYDRGREFEAGRPRGHKSEDKVAFLEALVAGKSLTQAVVESQSIGWIGDTLGNLVEKPIAGENLRQILLDAAERCYSSELEITREAASGRKKGDEEYRRYTQSLSEAHEAALQRVNEIADELEAK